MACKGVPRNANRVYRDCHSFEAEPAELQTKAGQKSVDFGNLHTAVMKPQGMRRLAKHSLAKRWPVSQGSCKGKSPRTLSCWRKWQRCWAVRKLLSSWQASCPSAPWPGPACRLCCWLLPLTGAGCLCPVGSCSVNRAEDTCY